MTNAQAPFAVRSYQPSDEGGWLRCRVLSFLDTQYYDDVKPKRTTLTEPSIALVAVSEGGEIIGVLDIEIDGSAATIDTIATHPDHRGRGVASALLRAAVESLREASALTLDAWTREDQAAGRWYQHNDFTEQFRYLHVYVSDDDDAEGFTTPDGLSQPINAFLHATIEHEQAMRARYRRVYVCRQYVRAV